MLQIDRQSETPLYVQLRDALLRRIEETPLKVGDRLPTVTALSRQLGVTATTVRRALEDLTREGRVVAHVGRGTFVADPAVSAPERATGSFDFKRSPIQPADPHLSLGARRLRRDIGQSLNALQTLADRPGTIAFTAGTPDERVATPGILDEMARATLSKGQGVFQGYGPVAGLPALREAIAARLSASDIPVSPEQVLITSGSQQAVALLAQYALEERRRVLCETPCYMGVPQAFEALGHWVESVVRDGEGPKMDRIEAASGAGPSLLYLCHEIHNPMGVDLSPARRAAVLVWARRENAVIVADEIFRDLRYDPVTRSSFLAESGLDQVVLIGSFSKSFMCGLRVGYLVTSVERMRTLTALKRAADISSPPLMQGIALEVLTSGAYAAHVERACAHYRERCDALMTALDEHMPKRVTWTRPVGGFHCWVELPQGYSSLALFLLAVERGVEIVPGPRLDIDHRFVNGFRLSYGSLDPPAIREGVEMLADAVKELLTRPPGEAGMSGLGDFV